MLDKSINFSDQDFILWQKKILWRRYCQNSYKEKDRWNGGSIYLSEGKKETVFSFHFNFIYTHISLSRCKSWKSITIIQIHGPIILVIYNLFLSIHFSIINNWITTWASY